MAIVLRMVETGRCRNNTLDSVVGNIQKAKPLSAPKLRWDFWSEEIVREGNFF